MKQIDIDGTLFLIDDVDRRYRYKLLIEGEWKILIRDDGYRIESIFVSEKPIDPPIGKREWELMFEYKHCEAPGQRAVIDEIMKGGVER